MPAISRLTCANCSYETAIMDHLSLYDGKTFHPLHHPGETRAIEAIGFTVRGAYAQGRVWSNNYQVCLECRSVVSTRELAQPAPWIFRSHATSYNKYLMAAVIVPALVLTWVRDWPGYALVPLVAVPLIAVDLLLDKLDQRRATRLAVGHSRALEQRGVTLEVRACSLCGSERLTDYLEYVIEARRSTIPGDSDLRCPECDRLTLHDDPNFMWMA